MSEDTSAHITAHGSDEAQIKRIWKTFWILLVLTIIELALGLSVYKIDLSPDPNESLVMAIKGIICILTLAKAFYIISIFMHLGDEVRNMVMSVAVPATLFIWFIIAFIYDGNSFKKLRNTDAGSRPYIEQKQYHHVPEPVPAEKSEKKLQ
ncbi:MAG: cytochrome C oxidase subunit IV family protein [Ginsengibacter sp.]